ncbi:MAG: hypothetical protein P8P44_04035, partial [Alphaproteobacteria bacterium]|nr:hypothetical protein [Alphaproteobacteria bacterium]
MKRLLAHKRFALFAPIVALALIAVVAFGLWVLVTGRIGDELAARGLGWQTLSREGFPARISLYIKQPVWRDPEAASPLRWQNSAMSFT